MNKKEILDILDNAKDESGAVPMRLVRQAFDKLVQPEERTETHACELISRQAAIDAYGDWYVEEGTAEGFIGTVKQLLEGLPPAQPERKKGKWIQNNNGTYSCSLCHSWIPEEQYYYAQFCLYCGADMRGEQE